MRVAHAALAALLAAASPAAAQECWCDAFADAGPASVAVPPVIGGPGVAYVPETVLVPRTRYERRVVLVPRTRLVPRTVYVPRTIHSLSPPIATYVPPGTSYRCRLGTIGCDSGLVGPLDD